MTDSQQRPFSIRIFVPDGDPDGLRIVEKSNWTGVGIVFRRTIFKQAAIRPEFENSGVYILIGSSDESSLPTVYIGEGDPVSSRLRNHNSQKDFWDWCVFFVTKDCSLNKAHIKYLESQLLELAKEAKQCNLDNSHTSLPPSLSEAEIADADSFMMDMLNIFPLLGLSVFDKTEMSTEPQKLLYLNARGIKAIGYESTKGFIVKRDSEIHCEETPSIAQHLSTRRTDLWEQQIVTQKGNKWVFLQDYVFQSPSTASGTLLGRRDNGRVSWKTKSGKTLKELQEEASQEGSFQSQESL